MPHDVLRCEACGGAVLIADETRAQCVQCERWTTLPVRYQRAVAAVRAAQGELERATALWRRHMARSVPRWLYRALSGLGLATILTGYVVGLLAARELVALPVPPRTFVGLTAWMPQLGLTFAWVAAYWYMAPHETAAAVSLDFMAVPGALSGCRQCGAPLARAPERPVFARCVFCGTDNLLGLGEQEQRALQASVDRVRQRGGDALAAEALRRSNVADVFRMVLFLVVPFQALPLVWAFALPDASQGAFGFAVASWGVGLSAMLLAAFLARNPAAGEHLVAFGAALIVVVLHCVFVGSLG